MENRVALFAGFCLGCLVTVVVEWLVIFFVLIPGMQGLH